VTVDAVTAAMVVAVAPVVAVVALVLEPQPANNTRESAAVAIGRPN
jgi:hypothetical protein